MISKELLQDFESNFNNNPCHQATKQAIAKVGVHDAAFNQEVRRKHPFVFSHETGRGEMTNQKSSGRCWMFAALNTIRVETMERLNIENFEFSQNYTLFWDKLERFNYVLTAIIDTIDQPLDSRLVWHLLQNPMQDGGQWEMFAGILKKYGSVPKEIMPETYHSSNTHGLNQVLNSKVREYAARLRQMHAQGASRQELEIKRDEQLEFVYGLLVRALGPVPRTFDYAYRDKDGNYHKLEDISPLDFFERFSGMDLSDQVSLIHAPTADKPYGKTYTVKYLGSILEADPIKYLNVPIEVLKEAAISAIKDGHPVWFGCDVGKMSDRNLGLMDEGMYAYRDVLGQTFELTKEERLNYSDSMLTHAMVFVGVDLDKDGQPINWKVENSWGKDKGKDGIYSMSDAWFDEFNYQITVPRKYVPTEWLDHYDQASIELEPWDPMGALAFLS